MFYVTRGKCIFNKSPSTHDTAMDESNIIPFDQSKQKPLSSSNSMKSNLVVKASEIIEDPQILVNVLSKRVA